LNVDYIIVGQGIAGTLLAHFLQKANQKVYVFDPGSKSAASQVAAGIINPITGRRYVKSWRVDELIPFARNTYGQMEEELGIRIFHEHRIIRTLFNQVEENNWLSRTAEPGYDSYMLDTAQLAEYQEHTVPVFRYGEVQQAAQVDIGTLSLAYREKLLSEGVYQQTTFDFDQLEMLPKGVRYGAIEAKGIVFCEGAQAKENPFFQYLPFGGVKGEVLIVRIPKAEFSKIFKHRVFIVPLTDGLYWIGATYDRKYDHEQPTEKGRQFLEERLSDILKLPFEVMEHRAAIRPTVKDRRPFLGTHPDFPSLFIFNGLGTKGASLGPFWANHMTEYLLKGQPLDGAVDIDRFNKR